MTNKNPTIDIARGLAIILVVYGHVIEHSMAPFAQDYFQNPAFKFIYTFHMPLFVFISGYLIAGSLRRHSVGDVFKSRCKSLLVPFVTLAILGCFMAYALNGIFGKQMGHVDILRDLANQLLLKPSVWFLFTLFALSALLVGTAQLEKRWGKIAFLLTYILVMIIPYNSDCALYYIKWFYLFYLSGYFLNQMHFRVSNPMIKIAGFTIAAVLLIWLVSYWNINDYIYINQMNFTSSHYGAEILRIGYRYLMGFLGIVITFGVAEFLSTTRCSSVLAMIGAYSLDIYILQMFLLEGIYPRLIAKTNLHLDFNAPIVLYIAAPLIAIFFVSACVAISKLLIRKSHVLSKLLLGGR